MTDPKPLPALHVSGGVGGTEARLEDIEQLARYSEQTGTELAGVAAECHALLVHPDVVASAMLNPGGVASFERTLLAALDGRDGLSALAVRIEGRAASLLSVAAAYRATDEAKASMIDSIRWVCGAGAGVALANPLFDLTMAAFGAGIYEAGDLLGVDWQRLLTDHPGVVDNAVGMGPGLIFGLTRLTAADVPAAARLLAMLYPDGTADVKDLGIDKSDPRARHAPAGFGDLVDELSYRNGQAHGAGQGQIDVRIVTQPDGSRAYIVDIPGTHDWHPMPLEKYDKLNDLGTNLHSMGGEDTAYEKGVVQALHLAGAQPTDAVMLIGHSQGGIVATQTAVDLSNSGEFKVTHVLTAGSPIGNVTVPASIQVLSLENQHDVVPHLDAAPNADQPNRTTVTFDLQNGSVGDNHGIEKAYLPAASALDTSTDPAVAAYRVSASAFFTNDASQITTHAYQVTRG
jgi:predicted esterase